MVIDENYTFGRGAQQGNGIGYAIMNRIGGADTEVVALHNIGSSLSNDLTGIVVAQGDQLFFRFNTCGDAGGDIIRGGATVILAMGDGRIAAAEMDKYLRRR